jgi:peptide deformylase
MTRLTVLTVPDPRLRIKAEPVAQVDDDIRKLMSDLMETMYADDGAGLAAVQVGISKRVIVMDLTDHYPSLKPLKIANPEITWRSKETKIELEGCLSVPDQCAPIERYVAIKAKYLDENNVLQEVAAEGVMARCFQHEIDHLNGKVYIDYLSSLKRQILIQKAQKAERMKR